MPGHDIIAIGASAGGLRGLTAIVASLPPAFDAAVFVVQHLPSDYPTLLPEILADTGSLPAALARDGEPLRRGRIYIAPPDHHLLVGRKILRVLRGPRENRFRPSIDALFRSAARNHGVRVIGVVLSGLLDDGTVGLQAVKKQGGIAIVQDPEEAEYPGMPDSALRYVKVDHRMVLADICDFIVKAPQLPARKANGKPSPQVETEADIAEQQMDSLQLLESVETIGKRTMFTCPTCNGSLWQIGDEAPERFRCHVGHAFTDRALLSEQTRILENALWSAVRLMEEKIALTRRMAERRREAGQMQEAAACEKYAENLDREVALVRKTIVRGSATEYLPDMG